jgi:putative nucleotidyltransferase with HDIG domain
VPLSLAGRLALVTLAALVPVAASLGYTYRREQARQLQRVREQARRSAELLGSDTGRLLEEVRQTLLRLALLPAVRQPDKEGCTERLARTVADTPVLASMARTDPKGGPLCASHPAGRLSWLRHPSSRGLGAATRFSVGGYVDGPDATGLAVAVPVFDSRHRRVVGALVGLVDGEKLQSLVRGRPAGPGEIWALVDSRGRLAASWPEGVSPRGAVWPVWASVRSRLDSFSDGAVAREASWTWVGFRRAGGYAVAHALLADGNLAAVWAVSEQAAFADLQAAARRSWLSFAVAALAAATVAWGGSRWLILRPVRALVRAAERVRAGHLQVRTGLRHDPTEFGSLAGAFDGMVEALRAREAELAAAYDTTLEGWSRALDLRDRETGGHTLRVTALAVELARAMGMPEEQIVHLRRGALLHDIGKMAIPDEILHKPGPLTPEEMAVMRRHPQYAYELLWPIEYLRPALDIPYCHHERWDGGGYPRGLRGEEIPLAARIFAVVDVWDALSSERPYRPAWPPEQVRAYLRAEAGRQFDPTVVEVFLRLLDARGET